MTLFDQGGNVIQYYMDLDTNGNPIETGTRTDGNQFIIDHISHDSTDGVTTIIRCYYFPGSALARNDTIVNRDFVTGTEIQHFDSPVPGS